MRLWHTDLIEVLPRQQLGGQWNELGSIYKNQENHILINFVYNYPKEDLYNYSIKVINERQKRGYKYDLTNFWKYFDGEKIDYMKQPFVEKMTDKYLAQCYFNLMEKHDCGGMTDEEWENIDKVARQRVYNWIVNNLGAKND